ncbi:hypothetical protein [Histophilus somni]|nr:hypothetical protein [Histophilus somni]ACA30852.1 Haemophilus-specific protein, uncharacterized [Histophilus somni 2336]
MEAMKEAITNEDILRELQAVRELLKVANYTQTNQAIWTAQDVATYFKMSYEHTKRSIMSDPDFPDAVKLQCRTGGRSANRWIAGDVIAFARKRQRAKR